MARTLYDFVCDCCAKDRSPEQVRAVAAMTRWEGMKEAAENMAQAIGGPLTGMARAARVAAHQREYARRTTRSPRRKIILKKV